MGLVPLMIKDIAWPAERRRVYVTENLPWPIEVLVHASGLVPVVTLSRRATLQQVALLANVGWARKGSRMRYCIAACSVALLCCFASLYTMEVFSKRSALGCPVPVFIGTWHIIALVPGLLSSRFANHRRRSCERGVSSRCLDREQSPFNDNYANTTGSDQDTKNTSSIQAPHEIWWMQIVWGIYYIAGSLCFSSIMAVTVLELVVWVTLSLATAACSKMFGFGLCLLFEKTGSMGPDEIAMNAILREPNEIAMNAVLRGANAIPIKAAVSREEPHGVVVPTNTDSMQLE